MTPEMERRLYFAQETSAFEPHFMIIGAPMLSVLPRVFPLASSCSIMTGGPTNATTWGTRGSARLRRFGVILRETFVRLVPSTTRAHRPPTEDLARCTMVLLWEGHRGTSRGRRWQKQYVCPNNASSLPFSMKPRDQGYIILRKV